MTDAEWNKSQAETRQILEDVYRKEFDALYAAAVDSKGGKAYMDFEDAYVSANMRRRDAEEAQRMAEAEAHQWMRNYDYLSQRYLQVRGWNDRQVPRWPDGTPV